jgi:hypothetical protein
MNQSTLPTGTHRRCAANAKSAEPRRRFYIIYMAHADARLLERALTSTWKSHPIAGENQIAVVAASAGAAPRCDTPPLLVLISGLYRTFDYTSRSWAAFAERSSPCHLTAAFVSTTVDEPDERRQVWRRRDAHWAALGARSMDDVPRLVARTAAHTFGGRLAYASVHRGNGTIDYYGPSFSFNWHGAWVLAGWAADAHGVRLSDNCVVVRSRPDVALPSPIAISTLTALFSSPHGSHVALGQEGAVRFGRTWGVLQSDVLMLLSWGALTSDIALPIEASAHIAASSVTEDATDEPATDGPATDGPASTSSRLRLARILWDRAHLNGWGYGRTIANGHRPPNYDQCLDLCICLDGSTACGRRPGDGGTGGSSSGGSGDGGVGSVDGGRGGGDRGDRGGGGSSGGGSSGGDGADVVSGSGGGGGSHSRAWGGGGYAFFRRGGSSSSNGGDTYVWQWAHLDPLRDAHHSTLSLTHRPASRHAHPATPRASVRGSAPKSCMLSVVESGLIYPQTWLVRNPPSTNLTAAASAAPVDPAASVRCYCPERTSNASKLAAVAGLVRSVNNSKIWLANNNFYRCYRGVPLAAASPLEATLPAGCGDQSAPATPSTRPDMHGAHKGSSARVTRGNVPSEQRLVAAGACAPRRFSFSIVMPNELPRSGHEAAHFERMRAALKRHAATTDSAGGGTLVPTPGGPGMIFGANYVE